MAEITTDITQEQPVEPLLIDYNGSQYDYDEFKKLAYSTLGDTFQKYGKKYYKNFDELKKDLDILVNAIGETYNGTPRVTIYSDRIEDRKGELKNESKSDKAIKDRMGYIGGHIVKTLNSMSSYLKPEPEPKKLLSQELLTKDFYRKLFNQETRPTDLTDWYNQDILDKNTRDTTQRMNSIINALNSLNYGEDYETPEGFQNWKLNLENIISDNKITENEYAALNNIFGWDNGVNWNALLKTDFSPEPTETQLQKDSSPQPEIKSEEDIPKPVSEESDIEETAKLLTAFEQLSSGINIEDVFSSPEVLTYFTQELGVDADSIFQIALLKLIKDGNAISSNGKHYFPTIKNKNGKHPVLTTGNNKRSIDWVNENDKDWAVMPQNAKKGGVLKAGEGDLLYNSLNPLNTDYYTNHDNFSTLGVDYDYSTPILYTLDDNNEWNEFKGDTNLNNIGYKGVSNNQKLANTIESNLYYKDYTELLKNNPQLQKLWYGLYNHYTNAQEYHFQHDADNNWILPTKVQNQRKGTNYKGEKYKTYTDINDYTNAIRNDNIISSGHTVTGKKGTRYYYLNDKNEKVYVEKPEDESKWTFGEGEQGDFDNKNLIQWTDVKLTPSETRAEEPAESTAAASTSSGGGSALFNKFGIGGGDQTSTKKKSNFEINWIPELIDIAGLGSSWYFNKKAFNARKRRPYLTLSPEYKTFVRGDLNAYLAGVNQGADLMSRTNLFGMTSDANSNNAAMFNAWLNASKYKDQGRQEYDKKTYETLQKANELGWKNIDSHIANANSNKKNIYETQWYNGDLKGQYYISNYNSLQNFLNNLKQPFLDDRAQKRYLKFYSEEEKNSLLLKTLSSKELGDYKRRLNEWTEQFLKDNPNLRNDYKYAYDPIYQQGVDTLSNQYYLNLMTVLLNNNLEGNLGTYDAGYTKTLADWMKKYRELRTQNTQTEP